MVHTWQPSRRLQTTPASGISTLQMSLESGVLNHWKRQDLVISTLLMSLDSGIFNHQMRHDSDISALQKNLDWYFKPPEEARLGYFNDPKSRAM